MDERLVVPNALRSNILRSLRYGQPGRDSMAATVANVWWPRLHRELVVLAKHCQQSQVAGSHSPKYTENNQEVAIDFAGPFQNASNAKKYLLVSVTHYNGRPKTKCLRQSNTETVIDLLKEHKARHGISQVLKTDPATIF